jgi:hypothetical protein
MTKQEERNLSNEIAIECQKLALKILRTNPITDVQIDYALTLIRMYDTMVSPEKPTITTTPGTVEPKQQR